jgi:cytochrome d ubiquinol oxidase subunit I
MESFDALLLARIQFAFTISAHIIFPAFSIGLASYLAVLNGLWLLSGREVFLSLFDYWKKIFAVAFGMGVVSGVVMTYQFGTNWSVFSDRTGPVLGPLMAYEVLAAFFLEAGFLGIMLFGRARVGRGLHFFATLMVALGTLLSAFWILSANSWMHTPAGYAFNDAGQFVVTDWWAVIFNPSFPYRLVHMVLASYLTTAFVVGAVGAYHLLSDRQNPAARVMFSMAMWMAALVAPLQILAGDLHGLNTLKHQPAKIAAMEGHFETAAGAPLILFGIPNAAEERTDYAISIPQLGSLILTHDPKGVVRGLKEWPKHERPPVGIVFWSFRIMMGIGFAMLGIGAWSLWLRYRRRLHDAPWMHRAAILMGPSGFAALLAGWFTTEVGRQPYTVYGLMTTAESVSAIDAAAVGASLTAFIVVYFAIFGAGTFYIVRLMRRPPAPVEPGLPAGEPLLATRPV